MLRMLDHREGSTSGNESDDAEATVQSDIPIPLDDFPPMLGRGSGYRSEPFLGICIVTVLSALLVGVTNGIAVQGSEARGGFFNGGLQAAMLCLVWAEAALAILCMLYLLFGNAGVIKRSMKTCYPIPAEVEIRLREGRSLEGLKNVVGPQGSETLGTYCVRCLVWRPPKEETKCHHCQTCNRCVTGFDHHCGVFGRCIVRGNMPCFFTLIGMMFAGMATAMIAITTSSTEVV